MDENENKGLKLTSLLPRRKLRWNWKETCAALLITRLSRPVQQLRLRKSTNLLEQRMTLLMILGIITNE